MTAVCLLCEDTAGCLYGMFVRSDAVCQKNVLPSSFLTLHVTYSSTAAVYETNNQMHDIHFVLELGLFEK